MMVDYTGLHKVVEGLSHALDMPLESPPTHIILYRNQLGERGFALINQRDVDEKTELVVEPELTELKEAIQFIRVFG